MGTKKLKIRNIEGGQAMMDTRIYNIHLGDT